MKLYASKCDGASLGVNDDDIEKLAGAGTDTVFKCEATKNRNYANLKRYFAFIRVAFDMQNRYDDIDIFRTVMQMGAGYFTTAISPKGVTLFIPDSISFNNIEEEDFKVLFKKVLNYYLAALSNDRVVTNDEFLALLDFD